MMESATASIYPTGQRAWDFASPPSQARRPRFEIKRVANAMKPETGRPVADGPPRPACCLGCRRRVNVIDTTHAGGFRGLRQWLALDANFMPHTCDAGAATGKGAMA